MKRLYRSRQDVKLSGVIGGLGEFWDIDANLLRLATILLCLATGVFPLLITYAAAWAIIPETPGDAHPVRKG
ncbi:MAG: PspC domain-containing protein [Calditrichaeota bacterium]|nr:PspC domain-containing protein [Calditrichota bacterium]